MRPGCCSMHQCRCSTPQGCCSMHYSCRSTPQGCSSIPQGCRSMPQGCRSMHHSGPWACRYITRSLVKFSPDSTAGRTICSKNSRSSGVNRSAKICLSSDEGDRSLHRCSDYKATNFAMQSVTAIRKLAICQTCVGANDNRFCDRKRNGAPGGFFNAPRHQMLDNDFRALRPP